MYGHCAGEGTAGEAVGGVKEVVRKRLFDDVLLVARTDDKLIEAALIEFCGYRDKSSRYKG